MKKTLFFCVLILALSALSASAAPVQEPVPLLPDGQSGLTSATLVWQTPEGFISHDLLGEAFTKTITDEPLLKALYHLLQEAQAMEAATGCPFHSGAMLHVSFGDGQELVLELAWDSCTVLRQGAQYYDYMPPVHRDPARDRPDNSLLFDLFLTGAIEEGLRNSIGLDETNE